MRKIKVACSMGLQGCSREGEIEVEDEATPEEVEGAVREWALEHFEWWSEEVQDAI